MDAIANSFQPAALRSTRVPICMAQRLPAALTMGYRLRDQSVIDISGDTTAAAALQHQARALSGEPICLDRAS